MRFWVLDFQCPKMEKYISISILSLEISYYGLLEEHLTVNFFLQRTSVFIRVNFFNPYSSTLAKKTVHYRPLWWPSLFNNLNTIYLTKLKFSIRHSDSMSHFQCKEGKNFFISNYFNNFEKFRTMCQSFRCQSFRDNCT